MQFMMPQGKGMRGNGGGGGGGGGSGGRSSGRAPYSSSQEGIEAFDGPRGSAADADRSDGAIEVDDGHRRHHDNHDHHQGTAKVQEEALRGRFSYLDIADRVKCLLTNTDDHVRRQTIVHSTTYCCTKPSILCEAPIHYDSVSSISRCYVPYYKTINNCLTIYPTR